MEDDMMEDEEQNQENDDVWSCNDFEQSQIQQNN